METGNQHNWYVVYTVPNLERKIHLELEKQKIKAYLPMQRVIRQWSDRKKELQIPMFPSYVFVKTTEKLRSALYGIHGILKFVTFNGRPVMMSDDEISQIMQFENTIFKVDNNFIQGDDVIITNGPFTGLKGNLFCKHGKQRFEIILKSINQSLYLEVAANCLRKLV
ncbi:MAG: UpxY family transcription antiterminator [Mucilaginibacter sp.]|nr:UpxY family transcription antiterminator [Mucilaginibacter sp.]